MLGIHSPVKLAVIVLRVHALPMQQRGVVRLGGAGRVTVVAWHRDTSHLKDCCNLHR